MLRNIFKLTKRQSTPKNLSNSFSSKSFSEDNLHLEDTFVYLQKRFQYLFFLQSNTLKKNSIVLEGEAYAKAKDSVKSLMQENFLNATIEHEPVKKIIITGADLVGLSNKTDSIAETLSYTSPKP